MNDRPEEYADDVLPGVVGQPSVSGMPEGYIYGVTRYADVILANSFPTLFNDLVNALNSFTINFTDDIAAGGGSRARHTKRFDESLYDQGWNKHNVTIEKLIDERPIFKTRSHEIDVFKLGEDGWYPGVAVEMEWNNKDPFYARDLQNFSGLHNEGVIAVGVIVTRGPRLQAELEHWGNEGMYSNTKYGKATTHWNKLLPQVNLGGGGQCPLFLVGIEPERVIGWPGSDKI
ncbi:BglII/BstYI family type II restriction endonuclease [Actinomyces sp. 565]|uniref:BglII/BstYI family type II restriction endonuclease n=1 Tax=Actinomyces sp. 565 TaxID=2057794 RepID=UPI0013A6E7FD|nr:BglII/BstYI family type II restriction endonuclease [Actinomyces sp. 565]NDR54079.1 hypothetical protein [Actinomyces sp. 565]